MSKSVAQTRRHGETTTDEGGTMTVLEAPAVQQVQRTHLLWAGMASGPLFVALSFAQVPFRDGFELTKHPFSFLLLGPGGWLQSCNFILAGVLYGVSGVGLRRALPGRTGRWTQLLITTMGTGMVVAGLFPPDPSYGYPEGAPAGVPADLSIGGIVHGLAFAVSMLCWCALLAVTGLWLRRSRRSGWATVALITAVALLVVPVVSTQPFGTVVLYVVSTGAFAITSALLAQVSSQIRADR
jgi:hypothetical membrane protein